MIIQSLLTFLLIGAVCATYGDGGSNYAEYDCGGSCGGGCSQSSSYSQPCGGGQSAPVIQYESVSSGCGSDDCAPSSNYGSSSRYSSGRSSSSGYHRSSTTITKETRNDHLKIVVGQPQAVVHRTTYVQQPAPVVVQRPIPQAPVAYKKHQRYVDESPSYSSGGSSYDSCGGPCGGGSKIVKIIKKTYSAPQVDVCTTCGGGGETESYSSNVEYSQPIVTHRKITTRVISQPVVTRVIKKTYVQPVETASYYEDSAPAPTYTKRYSSGGSGGYGGGRSKAFAFASASASAGAGAGAGSGDYTSGGGGGGCKSGCDEWKK